jgi:3,4-dihydroxy 2-butanone 4-phosphate synthase/GTP cyclohydrolase II
LVAETSNKMVSSVYGGDWQMRTFKDEIQGGTHVVLSKGTLDKEITVLTRMHVFNPFEDALGINDGNSPTLSTAMRIISQEGRGVVVLLRDMNATLSADSESSSSTLREYGLGAQILAELGLGAIELLTNSPSPKVVGLDAYGLKISGTRPLTHEELDDNS